MYNEAYAKCRLVTGDDHSSGGCAVATSFGVAFAEACAAATAEAFATVDAKACDCDIGYYVDAVAWAVEYKCATFLLAGCTSGAHSKTSGAQTFRSDEACSRCCIPALFH